MDRLPALQELAALVDRAVPPGESHVRQGPLWAVRFTEPAAPVLAVYGPMLCVVAQGEKTLHVGDERLFYGPGRFFLNTVAVPAAGGVVGASPSRPCLWAMLELDPATVTEVLRDLPGLAGEGSRLERAMETPPLDAGLLDAVVRLARLLASPDDADFLRPLLLREIVYRLARGDQASRLRQVATAGHAPSGALGAVEWLRRHYRDDVSVEDLARECGLSPSALHRQFKRVTAMTPVQFQRRMRLQEASRLMVGEGLDAASAGARVGYDDPSYFSREYRRFFGDPPRRHAERLRSTLTMGDLA